MSTYLLRKDGTAITCLRCARTSYNMADVRNLYCGHCKLFHVPADGEAKLVGCAMYIYRPGATEPQVVNIRLPVEPSFADLKKAVLPHLDGAEYFEHVNVLFEGGPADMFVDEIGHKKQLSRNELATAIYRAAWLDEHPTDHPESLPWIAGPAVLFGRRVWS